MCSTLFCTFLCRCFARLQRETSRNVFFFFFLWRKFRTYYPSPFFFTAAQFHFALVAVSISHFVTAATKFLCCPSDKKCLLCFFISCSRSLSPFFASSFAGLPPTLSFFFCLCLALCSKFRGHDN